MLVAWWSVLAAATACSAQQLAEDVYHKMPRLFDLDEYETCLSQAGGVYCLGTFKLQPKGNQKLFEILLQYSKHKGTFNHTRLHRGVCVSARCGHLGNFSRRKRFQECINEWTTETYGLEARLASLDYCKSKSSQVALYETQDIAFLSVVGILILCNCVGTVYQLMYQPSKTVNQLVMSWSVVDNWRRLVVDRHDGDPRLLALKPLQGLKAITLMGVLLAHAGLAYYRTYLHNPRFFEQASSTPFITLMYNGSLIVQIFVMTTSFLLTYNMLLYVDKEKKPLSLAALPQIIILRLIRLAPLLLLVLWWAATWWVRLGDGPMWTPLVGTERARCRQNWWAQLLFVNNFVPTHERCLIQTWFLSVDLQLCVVTAALGIVLMRRPRQAVPVLTCLFLISILINFIMAYKWNMKGHTFLIRPEILREDFRGHESFEWLYAAPWGSLPTAVVGQLLAFLYNHMQKVSYDLKQHKLILITCHSSLLLMVLWVMSGWCVQDTSSPLLVALYSAIDRPVFSLIASFAVIGLSCHVEEFWWQFLSWRGWQILARMSLSIFLVHWCLIVTHVAVQPQAAYVSSLQVWSTWMLAISISFLLSLPVHLLVEAPAYRFLRHLLFSA